MTAMRTKPWTLAVLSISVLLDMPRALRGQISEFDDLPLSEHPHVAATLSTEAVTPSAWRLPLGPPGLMEGDVAASSGQILQTHTLKGERLSTS
eukprot:7012897-Pyramimonas_sp.AAC.1